MPHRTYARLLLWFVSSLFVTLACGLLSGGLPGFPNFAATETQDAVVNAATPASPLSGDWKTSIDSGTVVFHIARDGSRVNSVDLQLKGWHCGGTTLTTTLQARADWPLQGDQLSVTIDLNPPHVEELSFDGTYDESSRTWSGTWDGDEYGTHCGGDWQASR